MCGSRTEFYCNRVLHVRARTKLISVAYFSLVIVLLTKPLYFYRGNIQNYKECEDYPVAEDYRVVRLAVIRFFPRKFGAYVRTHTRNDRVL